MTIAIDVGNTNAVFGKIKDKEILDQLRVKTNCLKNSLTEISIESKNEILNLNFMLIIILL